MGLIFIHANSALARHKHETFICRTASPATATAAAAAAAAAPRLSRTSSSAVTMSVPSAVRATALTSVPSENGGYTPCAGQAMASVHELHG